VDFYPSTTVTYHIITITIMYRRQDVRLISPRSLTTLRTCILSTYNFTIGHEFASLYSVWTWLPV